MSSSPRSLRLDDLSWPDVRERLESDSRLIVPAGACDQYGAHLPIGTSTLVAEAFADRLSAEFQVLRAPALSYGVNVPTRSHFPGTASLGSKTLHRLMNDLLASWEDHGFTEFILLTVHDYDDHVEALATVTRTLARIRVVEILNLDLSEFLESEPGPQHGGEAATSLMLHLYPERVRMDRAEDFVPADRSVSTLRRLPAVVGGPAGSLGQPSLATAEKGRRLYEHLYGKIRDRIFLAER